MSQTRDAWKSQTSGGCTLTFSSLLLTLAAEYESQAAALLEQPQMDLAGQEFHSDLDMDSFLKLNSAGDHVKEAREGELPLNRLLTTSFRWWFWSQAASVIADISSPHLYCWQSYIVVVLNIFLISRPLWPDWRTDLCRLWGPENPFQSFSLFFFSPSWPYFSLLTQV